MEPSASTSSILLSKWRDLDLIYQFNDLMIDTGQCGERLNSLSVDDLNLYQLSACQKEKFSQLNFLSSNLESIKFMEYKNSRSVAESAFLYKLSPRRTRIFTHGACLGFCKIPQWPIYKTKAQIDWTHLSTCKDYIGVYLLNLKNLFNVYSVWHFRLCILQLSILCIQYYKLPAETKREEILRAENERSEWVSSAYQATIKRLAFLRSDRPADKSSADIALEREAKKREKANLREKYLKHKKDERARQE